MNLISVSVSVMRQKPCSRLCNRLSRRANICSWESSTTILGTNALLKRLFYHMVCGSMYQIWFFFPVVTYFSKMLYLRSLIGFWIRMCILHFFSVFYSKLSIPACILLDLFKLNYWSILKLHLLHTVSEYSWSSAYGN